MDGYMVIKGKKGKNKKTIGYMTKTSGLNILEPATLKEKCASRCNKL